MNFDASLAFSARSPLWAGMPGPPELNDLVRLRVENLSFFLFAFLASAGLIAWIWNTLRHDFPALPRLSYGKALGLTLLWSLLFILVLTMIAGARELLTPGAWEKTGSTYRLAQPPQDTQPADHLPASEWTESIRREKLEALRFALWEYARHNGGQFPSSIETANLPEDRWLIPGSSGLRFLYNSEHNKRARTVLAYEPEVFPTPRLVLFTTGEIRMLESAALTRALKGEP